MKPPSARRAASDGSPRRPAGKSYLGLWLWILAGCGALAAWTIVGRALVRRVVFAAPPIAESARTESAFLAVLLPHISASPRQHAMSRRELRSVLNGIKNAGWTSIGLADAAAVWSGGKVPPRSVLLAFAAEDPASVSIADATLRSLRMRGTLFLDHPADLDSGDARHHLTRHAIAQLRRGGGWDIGWISQERPPSVPEAGPALAVLDDTGSRPAPADANASALRFVAGERGLNTADDDRASLRILALRPDRTPRENLDVILRSAERDTGIAEDFSRRGLGTDWIAGWGVASMGNNRLALLPSPRQTGASVFLRGTERWRDCVIEFELKRYQKEFWAYARYADDGSFVRVGARAGYWFVEQKAGARYQPSVLARAPLLDGALPARVRVVLKGREAIVHVNGLMQFGRPLKLHPAVDRGRVMLGVYDARSRTAKAVVSSLRASPLHERWVSPRGAAEGGFSDASLEGLREEAVYATAISPRWIAASADGSVRVAETQGTFLRSLAGFYGCRLMPTAELPAGAGSPLASPAASARLSAGLVEAVRELEVAGVNLRLRPEDAARPQTAPFVAALRAALRERRRELWLTVEGRAAASLAGAADGTLTPSSRRAPDLEVLEPAAIDAAGTASADARPEAEPIP